MGRVCHGPSLCGPSLLWAEFVMGRVCYGPSCPVTLQCGASCLLKWGELSSESGASCLGASCPDSLHNRLVIFFQTSSSNPYFYSRETKKKRK